jgi:hypothetical protein
MFRWLGDYWFLLVLVVYFPGLLYGIGWITRHTPVPGAD